MAEEQARHRASTEPKASTSSEPAEPSSTAQHGNTQGQDASAGPDPAVFEAAPKQADDSDAASRSDTLTPTTSANGKNGSAQQEDDGSGKPTGTGASEAASDATATATAASAPPDLPPDAKSKPKKPTKMETNYQELLRSYRIAHSQIKLFERALEENTPLNSIKDPSALIEYLNQSKLRSDMAVQEVNRVTAERDDTMKKRDEFEKEYAKLKDEISTLRATKTDEAPSRPRAEKGDEGEDMFSYDDEIPKLQAELVSKNEKIASLTSENDTLKSRLGTNTLPTMDKLTSGLADTLPAESGDDAALIVMGAEFKSLKAELKDINEQLVHSKAALERERSSHASTLAEKNSEIKKLSKSVATLNLEIVRYQKANLENKKRVEELTQECLSSSNSYEASETPWDSSSITPSSTKKKNKKKKKKGNATGTPNRNAPGTPDPPQPSSLDHPHVQALKTEISKLKDVIAEKDLRINKLSEQVGHKEVLMEEIDDLRDNLVTIGQDHVEAKDRIKELEGERESLQIGRQHHIEAKKRIKELEDERESLQSRISQLEQEAASFAGISQAKAKLEADHDSMKQEWEVEKKTLEWDLGQAQKASQDRFKELKKLKDYFDKLQPELQKLRGDSDKLKIVTGEVKAVKIELGDSEKRATDLQKQLNRSNDRCSQHESKIQLLNEQLSTEKTSFTKQKNSNQALAREYKRVEVEKDEEATKAKVLSLELEKLQSELSSLRPKVKELEDKITKLQREKDLAKGDLALKTQQYNSAQGLLASMREDKSDYTTREKELKDLVSNLGEDARDLQHLLDDRTRDTEILRRMLAETNERADVELGQMRSERDKATEERDQIEVESSNFARSRARENEALRNRTRELEHEIKTLSGKKDELEAREKEWLRQHEELGSNEMKAAAETEDLRSAVLDLRTALDASEQQVFDLEKQKADLRRLLDELRGRYERTNKELKSVQSRLNAGSKPDVASSGKNTVDSTRSSSAGSPSKGLTVAADANYLRGIFLQFLECREEKVRSQLIPVLGKLLGFDKSDEQRWLKACQQLQKPNR
ncbi:GRIP domain-containing protein [Nemania serpens]|nr:GRIP domain-containing protein [Nemania serpens]